MRKGTKKNNVTLREKKLANNNISLYLDIYRDGKRNYEFLKLYISDKPRTTEDRQRNKETLELAEKIRTEREHILNYEAFGYVAPSKQKINFLDFYQNYIDNYQKKDIRMIKGSFDRFKEFLVLNYPNHRKIIKPDQIDKEMVRRFVDYLQGKSVGEGARGYYQRFKKVVKYAHEQGLMSKLPYTGIICAVDDTALRKDVLSIEEIKLLANTPYQNQDIRRAFLFCLYAGLRYCDVVDLKYSNVDFANKTLKFEQIKTKGQSSNSVVTIPLNNTLLSLIGEKPKKDTNIFSLPSHTGCLKALRTWVKRAGIDKHITWHCARHSFAVNLLGEYKTDIKTVASLLGHSGLKHTEKYTRAVDELKKNAINSLPELNLNIHE